MVLHLSFECLFYPFYVTTFHCVVACLSTTYHHTIFSGYLRDVSGDYMLTYHFVGSLTICASFVLLISHYKLKDVSATVIEVDIEEIDETD